MDVQWRRAPGACVVNLGCKVNRVESDWLENALVEAGCALVAQDEADVVLINTCAVTGEAQAKTRKAARHAANLPRRPRVVVTGCAASLFPDELAAIAPNVAVCTDKHRVVETALGEGLLAAPAAPADDEACGHESGEAPADVLRPHGSFRSRRGIKVQDGCDNACTYCIVWRARGPVCSEPVDQIERQVRHVLDEGACEIVLTGINLGRFVGSDEQGSFGLAGLLDRVCAWGAPLVRVSSVEPPEVDADLVDALARNAAQAAPHLHLPLQSGCDATLARMGRRYTTAAFAEKVRLVRDRLPLASLSTDVIVGFPGEDDAEFERTLAFCREQGFSKMHVFRFSPRPGTPAATMEGQVPAEVSRERSERLRALGDELRAADACRRVGTVEAVLVERVEQDGSAFGTSASYHDVAFAAGPGAPAASGLVRARFDAMDEHGRLVGFLLDPQVER